MMKYFYLLLILIIAWNSPAQQLTHIENYGDWDYLYNGDMSNDGKWMFYESKFQSQSDTLHLKSTSIEKKYHIPDGKRGKFSENSQWFTSILKDSKLQIVDLKNDSLAYYSNVYRYNYTADESYLVILTKAENENRLIIKNLKSGKEISFLNIEKYAINPLYNNVALILETENLNSVNILDLKKNKLLELKEMEESTLKNLVWSTNGINLSFIAETKNGDSIKTKIYYGNDKQCDFVLDADNNPEIFGNYHLDGNHLEISDNGNRVYFKVSAQQAVSNNKESENIQEWNTEDKWIYPMKKHHNLLVETPLMWYWEPNNDVVSPISDTSSPEVIKINEDFVLKYDRLAYEPQYQYIGDVDLYLHNLKTRNSRLLLSKKGFNEIYVAPNGNSIVFFDTKDWWVYNLSNNTFTNLTSDVTTNFIDQHNDQDDLKKPFSTYVNWVAEEEAILVHDEFDVWKFSLDGKIKQRLTNGRESKRIYRIYKDFSKPKKKDMNMVSLKKGFILHAVDEELKSGFFYWQSPKFIEKIVFEAAQVDQLKVSSDMTYFTFRIQSYDLPPKVLLYSKKDHTTSLIGESNRDRTINDWGKSEMIEFSMDNGLASKSVLIYPANYDSAKEYPMIVYIYGKQPRKLHEFHPISWYSEIGFNPTHYALDGYFVLYPFISFEIGNPGGSALKYVTASVNHITEKVKIAENRIGLIGHSFGGYETSFIITQTDMFAAAVAGAAIMDMVNFYHTVNWDVGQEEMWRFESSQMRMGGSYYDLKDSYHENSPFHQVDNISTPLLLWAGKQDFHVNYNESIRLYLALRRLKKRGKLLLFENEHHTVKNLENVSYLTKSIKEWFDSFCK